jgi:hypothetical protein
MNTPEHAAASLEIAVRDAMAPLGELAGKLEAMAARLRQATEAGDTQAVCDVGSELLAQHAGFARVYRTWMVRRPGRPPWRSMVADAKAPSRLPAGSDAADRSST